MTPPRCTHAPAGQAATDAARYRAALPVLTTDRLTLRPPRIGDLPAWTQLHCDPGSESMGGPHDPEDAWEEFCVYVAGWLLHGHGLWAVERLDREGLVGFVLLGLEWDDDEPEIGWMLLPEARGAGYATEAARAVREYALRLFGPGSTVSNIDPANVASQRVAARLGAVRDVAAETAYSDNLQIWRHGEAS